uniref:G domain-containing protein n=1 Tax=Cannabis sativa TaxID=3483 RepID=A0A803P7C2_CANSA
MAVFLSATATKLSFKFSNNGGKRENPPSISPSSTGISFGKNKLNNKKSLVVSCGVKIQESEKIDGKIRPRKGGGSRVLSEGRDEDESYAPICPGCGVFMQDKDSNLPGFFQKKEGSDVEESELGSEDDELDWDSDEWEAKLLGEEEEDNSLDLDGFTPPGVGYGNITEDFLKKLKKEKISKSEKKRKVREEAIKDKEEVTVCARCHSLRNYGQVKNQAVENLIPDFDFDRLISTRLALEGNKDDPKLKKRLPKLVLVATKVDLLPSQISPTRLDRWVRHRARAAGAPKLSGVYLVSSRKDLGVRNLLSFIKELAGPRGNVWVIGAQNAGKSTLINALAKKESAKVKKLTEAPVPGTTLGIIRIGGILPAKAKLFDTPGLLHPYLVSMRLNREEQKMVEIRKELKARTYRMKASCSIPSLLFNHFMNSLLTFYMLKLLVSVKFSFLSNT